MKEEPTYSPFGPRAHERDLKLTPEKVQLADGTPLYHVFLENPDVITLSANEAQNAKSRLARVISIDNESVLSCQGKSLEEAKVILVSIETSYNQEAKQEAA